MSRRNILVLNGHPGQTSLSKSLCRAYIEGAQGQGHNIRFHDLAVMTFDPDFGQSSYRNSKVLEPALEEFVHDLEWAGHIVLATPMWWGAIPAKLKGLIDRSLLPGRAFDPGKPDWYGLPRPMLTGKTARVLLTSDTPALFHRLFYGNAIMKIISRQIFGFVGIKPTRFSTYAPASRAADSHVNSWLSHATALGAKAG